MADGRHIEKYNFCQKYAADSTICRKFCKKT